jgi:hypothetical protein
MFLFDLNRETKVKSTLHFHMCYFGDLGCEIECPTKMNSFVIIIISTFSFLKDLLIIELIVFFWWFNLSLGAHCGFVIEQMCYLFVAT